MKSLDLHSPLADGEAPGTEMRIRSGSTLILPVVGLILAVLPSIAIAQDSVGTVRGVVRNETGRPVEYALVSLDPAGANRQVRTDRDGRFSLPGAPVGLRALRV